jgi:hypothetical protein
MLRVTAAPSTHSPPIKFLRTAVMFSSQQVFLAKAGTFIVESPTGNQELLGKGVVTYTEAALAVERVGGVDRLYANADYSVSERSRVHENASKYKVRAAVLIQSEPIRL